MFDKKIITAQQLSIGYNKNGGTRTNYIHKDLNFELYEGELVCLLGANGVGKSTLLRTISGFQQSLSGTVYLYDKKIELYKEKELSKIIGLVLTDKTSAGGLTVRELVEMGRYPYTGFFGQLDENDKLIIDKSIASVGISHKANSYVAELSDGERQKAMIAKTLAQECPIIILDEPTAFLDIKSSIELISLLHNLAMTENKTILLTTHNMDLALRLSDRLWLLSNNNFHVGTTEDVIFSHYLDHFFDSENIIFDNKSGNFLPKTKGSEVAYIISDNHIYAYWTKNLLNRYSIQTTDDESKASFKIMIHSPTSIILLLKSCEYKFSNFEDLIVWLNYRK